MLHKDVLIRLCDARTLLRDTSEDRGMAPTAYREMVRPLVRVPGETPSELIPGCFSLMCGPAHEIRNF